MTDPANKTVLITGASGGFGRQMVRQFGAAGSKLILTDRNDALLRDAMDEAGDNHVAAFATDLSTEDGCRALVDACAVQVIVPDILVNNAGIAVAGRLDNVPQQSWETLIQLNLLGPMRLANGFLPAMVERGSGHIVNISSVAGWVGARGMSPYCASKFGLRGFGESLSADLDGTGVSVTNVYPCFSQTPILESPQYGYEETLVVPPRLISNPAHVVAKMIAGIRRGKLHVFPDRYARLTYYLLRFAPWLLPILDRRLYAQAIAAAKKND
ncbi:MAG: SDR family NAD(P)-dependent oxidoreductase [Woeseiaceae bacterium]|nr:SDR family NAD(P)-dependent oxidoreductase [Woeseiaceae bacterium]